MTDKEKIKAEIERRIKAMKDNFATNEASKSKHAYTLRMIDHQELLSFINSLPEEPVSEDLEEAFKQSFEKVKEETLCVYDYHAGFVDGAQWQKDKALEWLKFIEVKEVDLNEEIEKCLKRHSMLAVGKKDFTDIAKHFYSLGLAQKGE